MFPYCLLPQGVFFFEEEGGAKGVVPGGFNNFEVVVCFYAQGRTLEITRLQRAGQISRESGRNNGEVYGYLAAWGGCLCRSGFEFGRR